MRVYVCGKCGLSFRKLEWADEAMCPACGWLTAEIEDVEPEKEAEPEGRAKVETIAWASQAQTENWLRQSQAGQRVGMESKWAAIEREWQEILSNGVRHDCLPKYVNYGRFDTRSCKPIAWIRLWRQLRKGECPDEGDVTLLAGLAKGCHSSIYHVPTGGLYVPKTQLEGTIIGLYYDAALAIHVRQRGVVHSLEELLTSLGWADEDWQHMPAIPAGESVFELMHNWQFTPTS